MDIVVNINIDNINVNVFERIQTYSNVLKRIQTYSSFI